MYKNKFLHSLLIITALFLIVGCSNSDTNANDSNSAEKADQETYNWDFFTFVSSTDKMGAYYQEFVDNVAEKTDGRLNITIRSSGELPYDATEALTVVSNGDVELADGAAAFIGSDSKIASITAMPMLITSKEELDKAFDVLQPYLQEELESLGVEVLFRNNWTFQTIWTVGEPMKSLEDLKGKKLRTHNAEIGDFVNRLGASPIALSTSEVPSAISRGLADGVDTSVWTVYNSKWYEFLDSGYMLKIGMSPSWILGNSEILAELPDDLRTILMEESEKTQEKMFEEIPKLDAESLEKLETEHNMEIVEPTEQEIKETSTMMVDYWESWAKDQGSTVEEAMTKVREALGK